MVYKDIDDLKAAGQRIVYLTDPHTGHLGIFVSAKVARLEHRAILESLEELNGLAPGLYEMKIDNPSHDPDCHRPQYSVHFEEQQVENLKFVTPYAALERVRQVSEVNEQLYATFASPLMRAFINPWTAAMVEWLHPMRTSRYLLSERFSPWMHGIAGLARMIERSRTPLPLDSAYITQERASDREVTKTLEEGRKHRDAAEEQLFALFYGAERKGPVDGLANVRTVR